MLPSQTAYISAMKAGRTPRRQGQGARRRQADARKAQQAPRAARNPPALSVTPRPRLGSPSLGLLRVHRLRVAVPKPGASHLSNEGDQHRHISWLPDEVAVMEEVGNAVAAKAFAHSRCQQSQRATHASTKGGVRALEVRVRIPAAMAQRRSCYAACASHGAIRSRSQPPPAPCRAAAIEKPASPPPPHPQSQAVGDLINFDDPPVSVPPPALPRSGMSQADVPFFAQFGL